MEEKTVTENTEKEKKKAGRKFVKEFFAFIQRGNVIDLAVGIIVGGAFQKIVSSLVKDIVMPLLSLLGGQNLSDAKLILRQAVMEGETVVKAEIALFWGSFVQAIIDFLIIALAIFIAIKAMGAFREAIDRKAKAIAAKIKEAKEEKEE